ncbi:MAG: hypothetical protein EOP07_12655 [Proteobacteria bacterium]|nr:MAG: hypothetical protein EOP07_12655 [Pseudomonadota bacterium]
MKFPFQSFSLILCAMIAGFACNNSSVEKPQFTTHTVPEGTMYGDNVKPTSGSKTLAALEVNDPIVTQTYARQLASGLAGRPLTAKERSTLNSGGADALPDLIKSWLADPFFAKSFRTRIEIMIGTSGTRDGINFNLPGNLAEYIVKEKLPLIDILTADFCVDDKGKKIECDTGAPFSAGVIGTRGYLVAHNGRFNLGRANAMMGSFACSHYPMSEALQPRIPKEELIENFRIVSAEDAEGKNTGFGNGAACYICHGQFSAHSQFFVKFDDKGLYKAEATGIQSTKLEFGRADDGIFASHFIDPKRSADETGDMFGTKAPNLSEGMKVLTSNPVFMQCIVKQVITHAFNLDSESSNKITKDVMEKLANEVSGEKASVADVYQAVLTDPIIIKAFSEGVAKP